MDASSLGFITAELTQGWRHLWDGWSQLFVALIAACGPLIALHAFFYFPKTANFLKFLSGFLVFTAGMLGIVLADHLILLFIAWELTTLSSYFLILLKHHSHDARKAALRALLVTSMGGLGLLGGIILLGRAAGTFSITEILSQGLDLSSFVEGPWIAGLFLFGAMTKSAQFPFHFWLPGAMVAPVPVSAYLHSATMVKAGVYLLFRMMPLLATAPYVLETTAAVGLITFFWGAVLAVRAIDLKEILAHTTVSNLGLMVACTALPPEAGVLAILVPAHALYKAGLFLIVGILESATETRSRRVLSGLMRPLPQVCIASLLLAFSALGLPFTMGALSKAQLFSQIPEWLGFFVMWGLAAGSGATLFVSLRPFLKVSTTPDATVMHPPRFTLLIAPLAFAVAGLALPLIAGLKGPVSQAGSLASLWGVGAIVFSLVLFFLEVRFPNLMDAAQARLTNSWSATAIWNRAWGELLFWAGRLTHLLQPRRLVVLGSVVLVFWIGAQVALLPRVMGVLPTFQLDAVSTAAIAMCVLMFYGVYLMIVSRSVLIAVLSLGLVGYAIAVLFALYSAPDLSITQFVVETLSVLLFVGVLRKVGGLTHTIVTKTEARAQTALIALSILSGWCLALWVWFAASYPAPSRLKDFFAQTSLLVAKGRNVVNVILVDFRGFDTFGEITVVGLAGVGAWVLIKGLKPELKQKEERS